LVTIRPKYACRTCEGVDSTGPTVSIAPLPPQLLPRSTATPNLVAHIVTQKFCDALPLYRQESMFERLGVPIARAKMCDWLIKVAAKLQPLMPELEAEARAGPLIAIDETTLQVLDQPGRAPNAKSYVWVFCGGDAARPVVYFKYAPTRHGKTAQEFLTGYSGAVISDGFSGYNVLDKTEGIVHLGCWAHVRRKFADVIKSIDTKKSKPGIAHEAIARIRKLYAVEKQARDHNLAPDEIYALRQREARPVLDAMYTWLTQKKYEVAPGSLLGKAMGYALGQWSRLTLYIDDGNYRIDNNPAENAIRPFVVGRKNWLFCESEKGAHASATYYTLIETAKANGLEPAAYVGHLLNKLPYATTIEEKRALLPTRVTPEMLVPSPQGGAL
jgi:transposase